MRHVFFDIETTGFDYDGYDRIVSVGAVAYPDGSLTPGTEEEYHQLVNPEREVPPRAAAIHGLTLEILQDEPTFASIAADMSKFLEDAVVYAHNGDNFDFPFVDAELRNADQPELFEITAQLIDTLHLARAHFPGRRNSLDALSERAGLEGRGLHGALEDAQILAEIYRRLLRDD